MGVEQGRTRIVPQRADPAGPAPAARIPQGQVATYVPQVSSAQQMPVVIERLLEVYVRDRIEDEKFIDTVQRLGITPFKEFVYATPIHSTALHGEDEYV